ncbi:MAG: peroxiredoxin family protein [Rhodospirillaceae bacterium]|nr:peroxiredoxin family protein [Rhodospirillaceae bacterium]
MSEETSSNAKSMSLIVTKGSLDWAYPPFILATTAASMGLDVSMFFTFYGLGLLQKEMDLQVTSLGNPAMKMPMAGMHVGLPNLMSVLPGVGGMATGMMKNLIEKKGVASVEELRAEAIEGDVRLIGCQMTLDLFEVKRETLLDNIEIAGAATYVEGALEADINLFI